MSKEKVYTIYKCLGWKETPDNILDLYYIEDCQTFCSYACTLTIIDNKEYKLEGPHKEAQDELKWYLDVKPGMHLRSRTGEFIDDPDGGYYVDYDVPTHASDKFFSKAINDTLEHLYCDVLSKYNEENLIKINSMDEVEEIVKRDFKNDKKI